MIQTPAEVSLSGLGLGCLVWVPIAIWMVSLVHWTIQGELDLVVLVAAFFALVALGYATMNPPDPTWAPVLFGLVLGSILIFPIVRSAFSRRALEALEVERAEQAYATLRLSPNDLGARMKLARVLFAKGFVGEAVKVAEPALEGLPRRLIADEIREFEAWRYQAKDPALFRGTACLNCRTMNAPGEIYCSKCGAAFLLDALRGPFSRGGLGRKLIAAWALAVLLFIGIPAAARLTGPGQAVTLVALQVVIGAFFGWYALRDRGHGS